MDWPCAEQVGATLVAAEQQGNHGLWVLPGRALEDLQGRELRRRWEAEELQTEVTRSRLRQSKVEDGLASAGAARRGWPSVIPRERENIALVFGPYATLVPGHHEVSFRLALAAAGEPVELELDVGTGYGNKVLASTRLSAAPGELQPGEYRTVTLVVDTAVPIQNVEFRVFYRGGEVRVDYVETAWRMKPRGAEPPAVSASASTSTKNDSAPVP